MTRKQKLIARSPDDCRHYIIKALEKAEAAGHRAHTVFEDWLQLVEATLNELPNQLEAKMNSEVHVDSPETAELWARMRIRYGDDDPELYGLNGRYIEAILTMEEARFREVVPEAWQPIYEEAREANEQGDQEKVDEIAEFLKRSHANPSGNQQTLFEPKPVYVVEPYFIKEKAECELIAY